MDKKIRESLAQNMYTTLIANGFYDMGRGLCLQFLRKDKVWAKYVDLAQVELLDLIDW